MAANAQEALEAAAEIGYPVALKAVAPDILHKSDVGALAVNIQNDFELRQAYRRVVGNVDKYMPEAEFKGVSVQKMVTNAYEVIIGMNRDPQFGPLIMFGLGGIYVEVLQDVTFRLAPLSLNDVQEMITGIKSYPILRGVRGQPKADLKAVEQVLLRVSQLAEEWPQITDLDINPLMVLPEGQGAVAVDVRIGVGG
jgi:acetyltransferase